MRNLRSVALRFFVHPPSLTHTSRRVPLDSFCSGLIIFFVIFGNLDHFRAGRSKHHIKINSMLLAVYRQRCHFLLFSHEIDFSWVVVFIRVNA